MDVEELFSGSEAISTTEWSLTTDSAGPDVQTAPGLYQAVLDLSDMIAGDELQIRAYDKARSGDTQRIVYQSSLFGAQSDPLGVFPLYPLMLKHGWDFTLDAIAGTITVLWSIRRLKAHVVDLAIQTGSVATDGSNSATTFKTDLASAVDDFYKDAFVLLTSGALVHQVKKITAYNGTTKFITVSGGFTSTPADAVSFAIVNR